jgi:hypothetical protein
LHNSVSGYIIILDISDTKKINPMNLYDVPFPNTYWVEPGWFLAGGYPLTDDPQHSLRRVSGLIDSGIRYIIDLTEPCEVHRFGTQTHDYEKLLKTVAGLRGVQIVYRNFQIKDFTAPSRKQISRILDEIDRSIANNRPVYLHCWGGVGRTGTIVGCYLARHGYAKGPAVLDEILKLRKHNGLRYIESPQGRKQIQIVLAWSKGE